MLLWLKRLFYLCEEIQKFWANYQEKNILNIDVLGDFYFLIHVLRLIYQNLEKFFVKKYRCNNFLCSFICCSYTKVIRSKTMILYMYIICGKTFERSKSLIICSILIRLVREYKTGPQCCVRGQTSERSFHNAPSTVK